MDAKEREAARSLLETLKEVGVERDEALNFSDGDGGGNEYSNENVDRPSSGGNAGRDQAASSVDYEQGNDGRGGGPEVNSVEPAAVGTAKVVFVDNNGQPVDRENASRAIISEYDEHGMIVFQTIGVIGNGGIRPLQGKPECQ